MDLVSHFIRSELVVRHFLFSTLSPRNSCSSSFCSKMTLLFKIFTTLLCFNVIVVLSSVQLQDVSEGNCWNPAPKQIPFDYDWMMKFIMEGRYAPMASSYLMYVVHKMLTGGSPPDSLSEWDKICLEINAVHQIYGRGYDGKEFKLECNVISLSEMKCFSPGQEENATTLYLTWTAPNRKYVMLALCTPDNLKAWCLLSTENVVDEGTKMEVLALVEQLGFDPKRAVYVNYTGCPPSKLE